MNRTKFSFRIDRWDHDGNTIMDHVAGVENLWLRLPPTRRLAGIGRVRP
jgi:hypothetical protein